MRQIKIMSRLPGLTLIGRTLSGATLAAALASCSIIPGGPTTSETTERKVPVDGPSLRVLAAEARAAKTKEEAKEAVKDADEASGHKPGQLARKTGPAGLKAQSASVAQTETETEMREVRPASSATPAGRQAAALALLRAAKAKGVSGGTASGRGTDFNAADPSEFGRPKTYRIDGPQQPQAYSSQTYPQASAPQSSYGEGSQQQGSGTYPLLGTNGQQVASYPRTPQPPFEPPQQLVQGGGFQPPDPAPGSVRPNDPRALMDAVERLRAKQVVQPARVSREPGETTGSVQTAGTPEFNAESPLTFVQFAAGSTVLPAQGAATIAGMLKTFAKTKSAKVVATVGLGGPGEAYTKLLQANQRAQAIAEAMPPGIELIRRFDPGLPNESVRLFVVKSGT